MIEQFENCHLIPCCLTILPSCIHLGTYVFYNCTNIGCAIFDIGSLITTIPSYAFYGCINLKSVQFPHSLTSIGSYAFLSCIQLKTIHFLTTKLISLNESCFENCINLEAIDLPDSVKFISKQAFYGCTKITSFTLKKIESIGENGILIPK